MPRLESAGIDTDVRDSEAGAPLSEAIAMGVRDTFDQSVKS
jgi:hypothetical protein